MKKDSKHKKIQRKLLLYLENELGEKERELVRDHLRNCSYCSRVLEVYRQLWKTASQREEVQPPPYLWEKIRNCLDEIERSSLFFFRVEQFLRHYAYSAFLAVLISIAITAGFFIGSPSSPPRPTSFESAASIRQTSSPAEEFKLDWFDIIPPGSVAEIFYETE